MYTAAGDICILKEQFDVMASGGLTISPGTQI